MKISIFRKNDFNFNINVKYKNSESAFDLTSCKVLFMVADKFSTEKLINKEITSHTDALEGKTIIALTNEETDMKAGSYQYEIRVVDSFNREITFAVGEFIIKHSLA